MTTCWEDGDCCKILISSGYQSLSTTAKMAIYGMVIEARTVFRNSTILAPILFDDLVRSPTHAIPASLEIIASSALQGAPLSIWPRLRNAEREGTCAAVSSAFVHARLRGLPVIPIVSKWLMYGPWPVHVSTQVGSSHVWTLPPKDTSCHYIDINLWKSKHPWLQYVFTLYHISPSWLLR